MASGVVSVSTDTGTGDLYYVLTQSSTPPSGAQIMAGQDHLGAAADLDGSVAVVAPGLQSDSVSGLADATEFFAHFVHSNLGVLSNVFSAPGATT